MLLHEPGSDPNRMNRGVTPMRPAADPGFLAWGLTPVLFFIAMQCAAQTYPAKPVRFIAPYPAGGVNDIVARLIGQRMSAALGPQWVIDNRAGRGGTIGTDLVAKSPPDGYTLVHGGMGSLALAPSSAESLTILFAISSRSRSPLARLMCSPFTRRCRFVLSAISSCSRKRGLARSTTRRAASAARRISLPR